MLNKRFTIGLVQMGMSGDLDDNLNRATTLVQQAARDGAQVICLPEMFRSPYFCQVEDAALFDLAESAVQGASVQRFQQVAASNKVAVIVPIFEKRAPGLYHNSAVVVDADGELLGVYRKMHIPDDPAFYEKFYFTPGDLGFRSFDTQHGRVGTLICWDQWYPEAARLTALQGAAVLFYPTAIGWHPDEKAEFGSEQRNAWQTIQRSHAIANGTYVAAVNRIGHEKPPSEPASPGLEFWGSSFIVDPFGVVIAEASTNEEEILLAEIDPGRQEDVRRGWPFLRDRRIDAYSGLGQRFAESLPRPKADPTLVLKERSKH